MTKTKFLSMSNPRSVFLKALINIVAATETLSNHLFQQCFAAHLNFKKVVKCTCLPNYSILQRTNFNG